MIIQFTFTVETGKVQSENQIRESIQSLQGEVLHHLSDGASQFELQLDEGDIVQCVAHIHDEDKDLDDYLYFRKFSLGPNSAWERSVGKGVLPFSDSDTENDSGSRSVVDAEAVPSQLELFKSVRRKPTFSEMMTEVVEYCNRG